MCVCRSDRPAPVAPREGQCIPYTTTASVYHGTAGCGAGYQRVSQLRRAGGFACDRWPAGRVGGGGECCRTTCYPGRRWISRLAASRRLRVGGNHPRPADATAEHRRYPRAGGRDAGDTVGVPRIRIQLRGPWAAVRPTRAPPTSDRSTIVQQPAGGRPYCGIRACSIAASTCARQVRRRTVMRMEARRASARDGTHGCPGYRKDLRWCSCVRAQPIEQSHVQFGACWPGRLRAA